MSFFVNKKLLFRSYQRIYSSYIFSRIIFPTLIRIERYIGLKISFSQFGEDLFFENLNLMPGTYLEIGCNHPVLASNTFKLFTKGWKGVVVDGDLDFESSWIRARPKDKFVHALVSDKLEKVKFYKHKSTYVSSISTDHVSQFKDSEFSIIEEDTTTITDLIKQYKIQSIDILFIDIEGMDYRVLSSLDLRSVDPKYICIEDHEYVNDGSQISNFLGKNKYEMLMRSGPSFVYAKDFK